MGQNDSLTINSGSNANTNTGRLLEEFNGDLDSINYEWSQNLVTIKWVPSESSKPITINGTFELIQDAEE